MGEAPLKLREHAVTLQGKRVVLRPMTEDDWDLIVRWNEDAEVLYCVEGDDVSSRTAEDHVVSPVTRPRIRAAAGVRGSAQAATCTPPGNRSSGKNIPLT